MARAGSATIFPQAIGLAAALALKMGCDLNCGSTFPPQAVPYRSAKPSVVRSAKHLELSYETALKSMVLLKNDEVLPLKRDQLRSLFMTRPNVIGPEALDQDIKIEFRNCCLLAEEK